MDISDKDWSAAKGIADEQHFNQFVLESHGELIAPLIRRQGIKNADYLFRASKIIGEHKIIETDFADSPEIDLKCYFAVKNNPGNYQTLQRELFSLLRTPIKRILEKANKQIRETKIELELNDHRGIVFLVNDNFKSVRPIFMAKIIESILGERERYRSIDAVIYLTNHYVETSESPFANLLWVPMYKKRPSDELYKFIDKLGGLWAEFMNKRIGPFDGTTTTTSLNWSKMYLVSGQVRTEEFIEK